MCHTETLPPHSPPVAARCQHGQCRLCQIPPSEINTRLPLLFQGNAFSHKVGWFTYTNPKSHGVNTYIQRDCFMLRHFTPLPWRWSWERRHWNCSLHLRNLWAVLNGFRHIQFEVPVQIILVRLRRKTYIIIRNNLFLFLLTINSAGSPRITQTLISKFVLHHCRGQMITVALVTIISSVFCSINH